MENFNSLQLPAALSSALKNMGYDKPTPIQAQAIPQALEGRDILGSAQTGTGKTAAFSIPLIAKLMNNPKGSALVMTPTRELAAQVIDIMNKMLGITSRKFLAIIIEFTLIVIIAELVRRPLNNIIWTGTLVRNRC